MNPNKRPLSVAILGCVYIGVSVGFVYHLHEILARQAFHYDDLLVELTEKLYRGCTEISWFRLCASSDVKSYLRT